MLKRLLIRSGVIYAPRICIFGFNGRNLLTLARTIERGQYTEAEMNSLANLVQLEINGVILDAAVPSENMSIRLYAREGLHNFRGIVYLVDAVDSETIRRSIKELEDIVDDKEITQPILILFSPPTGDMNVENVIRNYNLTDIIDKGNGRVALFTYMLSPTQLSGYMEGFHWLLKKLNL